METGAGKPPAGYRSFKTDDSMTKRTTKNDLFLKKWFPSFIAITSLLALVPIFYFRKPSVIINFCCQEPILFVCSLIWVLIIGWAIFHRSKNDERKTLEPSLLIPLFITSGIIIWLFIFQYRTVDPSSKANVYDGFIEYLFAGIGIMVTFFAFIIQYFANRQHFNRFEETKDDNCRARFESTYFDALRTLRELVIAQYIRGIGSGQEVFRYMKWELQALDQLIGGHLPVDLKETEKQHIVFSFFLLGVSLDGGNKTLKEYCNVMGIPDSTVKDIFDTIFAVQRSDPHLERAMKKMIRDGKFSNIKDYALSSLWYKEKVMWYDGHKHRFLQFIRMRNYILTILKTDPYTVPAIDAASKGKVKSNELQPHSDRHEKYRNYLDALISEYEVDLIVEFEKWKSFDKINFWEIFNINKEIYNQQVINDKQ